MANEITYSGRLSVTKSNLSVSKTVNTGRADMAGDAYSAGVQSIPTTAAGTAVTIAATVATLGWSHFANLDGTNFVEVGVQVAGTFYPFLKLTAGVKSPPVPLSPGITLYARADTGACLLEHLIVEA